jgi:hypothetical protein
MLTRGLITFFADLGYLSTGNCLFVSSFSADFTPSGSESAFRIPVRIQIQEPIECGSGAETLPKSHYIPKRNHISMRNHIPKSHHIPKLIGRSGKLNVV